jgi:ABC-type phosphate transport system substrate-binding protein
MKKIIILLVFFAITLGLSNAGSAQKYKVIVHSENQVKEIKRTHLDKIFLKKQSKWEDGTKIKPVNLSKESSVRVAFTKEVHKKTVSAINAYWQKQIFTGKGVPPLEKANDKDVIAYVKSNPGAIGYVSGTANTDGVNTIMITK